MGIKEETGKMGNLTEHFSLWEFKCPCSQCKKKKIHIDMNLVTRLEEVRRRVGGKPVNITSGVRCRAQNDRVGGASNSPHLPFYVTIKGKKVLRGCVAADIQVKGADPIFVAMMAETVSGMRIGIYPNHVHIDVMPPSPSKFWLVKKYGEAPIYSGNEKDLQNFLRKENVI